MKCSDLIVKFEDILHSTLFGEADQVIATHQLFFFKLKNLLILYQKSKKQKRGCKLHSFRLHVMSMQLIRLRVSTMDLRGKKCTH